MGRWRVQVRHAGIYRAATFEKKSEARDWALGRRHRTQAHHIAAGGFAPVPKGATIGDLIDKYVETVAANAAKTKTATLNMLKDRLGKVKLSSLNAVTLRAFIDRRLDALVPW